MNSILPDDGPVSMPSMPTQHGGDPDALGRIDQYDLLRKLGGGGFGVVYLARDSVSGIEVALKTLHPLLKHNAEEMDMLREKFRLVHGLTHPNIAKALVLHPCREINVWDEASRAELRLSPGDSVMVMDYAPGVTLSQWRRQFPNRIVPFDIAIAVGRQIAAALDYAHSERIVHRDIKPGNIMVETVMPPPAASQVAGLTSREGPATCDLGRATSIRVRILDFGLAAEIRSSMSRVSTEQGDTSGTRPYMAPEQWLGKKQDGRTDQYALACVLYELLSGAPPFAGVFETGDPMIMRSAVISEVPDEIEDVAPTVTPALLRALAKAPKDRFPNCAALVGALSSSTEGRDGSTSRPPFGRAMGASLPMKGGADMASRPREPTSSATLEADVLRRKVALARALAEIPQAVRKDPEFSTFVSDAELEADAVKEALDRDHIAVANDFLDRASAVLAKLDEARKRREEADRPPGDRKVVSVGGVALALRWCPPGLFRMGSDNGNANEQPCVDVQIPTGFWMGETEVTQELWRKVMGNGIRPYNNKGGTYPMDDVSWNNCKTFVEALNSHPDVNAQGVRFSMPDEARWEYACRAGGMADYEYGAVAGGREGQFIDMGWYAENSGNTTKPVAQKTANAWGLCDMHGNVWEWCANVYQDHPDGSLDNAEAMRASGDARVIRGGCYWEGARQSRSATRWSCHPGYRDYTLGFRLLAFQDGN